MRTTYKLLFGVAIFLLQLFGINAQDTNIDLQTRGAGRPPSHETPSSTARWMQNPVDLTLEIAVTNLYAATNAYLEVDIGGQRQIFYGAGVDDLGNYIPTNYPPVAVDAAIRRQYQVSIVCPNSGPNGSPLFKLSDISDPNGLATILSSGSAPTAVSVFLWSNFSSSAQSAITNDNPAVDPGYLVSQTNLVIQLNSIITSGSIYDSNRFAGVTLASDTTSLLAQNPQGQELVYLNRLLLRDAYSGYYSFPTPGNYDDSGTAQINFFVKPPPQLVISKKQPEPQYTVLVNGPSSSQLSDGSAQVQLINSGSGFISTNNPFLQITKSQFGHFAVGDGCDDATKAPGQGSWLNIGPGCTFDTNRISLEWNVSLGRTFDGLAIGQLAIREPSLTRDTYTPYALYYNAASTNFFAEIGLVTTNIYTVITNTSGDIYTNIDSLLRQVMAYQTFVDIVTPDTNQTVLNFYFPSQVATNQDQNGVYTNITGSPFVSWTIKNPSPSTTNNLQIIEGRNGIYSTSSLAKTNSTGGVTWTLTQGSGTATRVETRQVSFTGSPATNRVELDTISYAGSSTPAYQCQETYHFYPWGSELVETRIPNNPDLVTSYKYYNHDDSTYDPNGYGYGQLNEIIYPDGYWEKREYGVLGVGYEDPGYWVACRLFHPYFDGANGGATSPDSATTNNSASEDIIVGGNFPSQGQLIIDYDQGKCVRATQAWTSDNGQDAESGNSTQPLLEDTGAIESDTRDAFNYSDDTAPGLARHTDYIESRLFYQDFYYDHGLFDGSSNEFVLDSTNHLYTWAGITNKYPDHMQTEIDAPVDYSTDFGDWGGNWADYYSGFIPSSDDYQEVDDHSLYNPDTSFRFFPGATRKNTRIYHAGNLIQTEQYVYLSAGSTDGNYISSNPQWALLYKIRYYVDSLGRATNIVRIDPVSGQTQTLYTADYRGTSGYDGELLLSETDETGQQKSYTYDSLQRVQTVTIKGYGAQPYQVISYAYNANGQMTSQTTTAGALLSSESWGFDVAGRLTNHVDQSGIATQTGYSADNLTTTNTSPGGIQVIQSQSIDRIPVSLQGNGTVCKFYEHDTTDPSDFIFGGGFDGNSVREQITHLGYSGSPRWQCEAPDALGNSGAWKTQPAGSTTTNIVTSTGWYAQHRVFMERNSYGIETDHYYDCNGNPYFTVMFDNDNMSVGRANGSIRNVININGSWYQVTTNVACLNDGNNNPTVEGIEFEQLNGFTGSETACTTNYDTDGNPTVTTTSIDRANNKITTVTSEPSTSSLSATNVVQNGLLISSSTLSVASPTLYFYDALGRTNQIQNPLGYSAYINYNPNTGWMTSQTDFTGQSTSYQYYNTNEANAGKLKCQTGATGKKTYYGYTTEGQLYQTWGDVPYPAEYKYNEYGDLTNLITFRGGSGWTSSSWPSSPGTGDNTYWIFDEASGALLKKIDALGNAVTYTYDTNTARLLTRSWARTIGTNAVTVTNSYDDYGELVSQEYSDGTPNVDLNNYNRAGLPREIIDGSGTNELTYDAASRLVSVTGSSGFYYGITVSNHFNAAYGRDVLKVTGLSSTIEDDYGYDSYGRLGTVGSGTCSTAYGYVPNSDLIQTTTCYSNFTPILTTTRAWDYGMRLRNIANVVNSSTITSHAYTYDGLNRRTQATLEDGSYWQYGYDNRDELTSAGRHWSYFTTTMPVSGQQFSYAYDTIGNRQTSGFGGDTNGANLRTITYTNNSLNQYIGIGTPGYENIIGAALATNSVTVNGGAADRHGEYFHREIAVANTNQPVWQNVTNIAGTFTNKGGLVSPANGQALAYDADGNLSFDGIWSYQWDGENRLILMTMTNVSGIANSNRLQLQFTYDYMGRRISKTVSTWNNTAFSLQSTNYFVYDGWNLIATFNPSLTIQQSYMWGNDLSGTIAGAGGVGGLLMAGISGTNCFAAYDGNGNITALINASDKSLAARYEYSPYGELLRETGLLAHQNPFRFSTKFWDDESGLVYYGHRYYNPSLGRWINRDSKGESGGIHLYQFSKNSPVHMFDPNGCDPTSLQTLITVGPEAEWADTLYTMSSWLNWPLPYPGVGIGMPSTSVQGMAAMECVQINDQLGGKLLQNIGGDSAFLSCFGVGQSIGFLPRGFSRSQSLDAAVVSGRLEALSAIGAGAASLQTGTPLRSQGADYGAGAAQAGYDFARDLQNGDTEYGDLDAALLGAAVNDDNALGLGLLNHTSLSGDNIQATGTFVMDVLNGDAAAAFSDLPEYQAENAWDMADSLQQ